MSEYYELHGIVHEGLKIFYTKNPNTKTEHFSQWFDYKMNNNIDEDNFFKYINHIDDANTIINYIDKNTSIVYDESRENIIGIFNKKTNLITKN